MHRSRKVVTTKSGKTNHLSMVLRQHPDLIAAILLLVTVGWWHEIMYVLKYVLDLIIAALIGLLFLHWALRVLSRGHERRP